jgi:deazaflavin-dependent oxidoreductase (nitroreductase family)
VRRRHEKSDGLLEEFRRGHGHVGGPFEGVDLMLLSTTSHRNGRLATHIVPYVPHEPGFDVAAAQVGSGKVPDWYQDLLVNHAVHVDLGTSQLRAIAWVLSGDEYSRAWRRLVERFPTLAGASGAAIPVVHLIPSFG